MFITILFTIANLWNQPICPSRDGWIKKIWCAYKMEYYWTVRNEIMLFPRNWMELKIIISGKISHTHTSIACFFLSESRKTRGTKIEGWLLEKRKEVSGRERRDKKGSKCDYDESTLYVCLKMSQWNPLFCTTNICQYNWIKHSYQTGPVGDG
jgi:hypothetical protein